MIVSFQIGIFGVSGYLTKQNDIYYIQINDPLQKISSKRIQTIKMKIKESRSPKLQKNVKRVSLGEGQLLQCKTSDKNLNQEYLSPINIKLAKSKPKPKKENKLLKNDNNINSNEDKQTKRKEKKKNNFELNSTIIINDDIGSKGLKKQFLGITKLKTKTTQKTFRNTSKPQDMNFRNKYKNEWFNQLMLKSTITETLVDKKKKNETLRPDIPNIPNNQEYLFIGDQFFLVNNLYPTKRLLNTFRQVCNKDQSTSKFITQDKSDRISKQKLQTKKKQNIFMEARKQIELNNKNKKATIIQRWWKQYLHSKYLNNPKVNPQHTIQQVHSQDSVTSSKISFKQSQDDEKRSPFDLDQINTSPIKDKSLNCDDSIIASFNSSDQMNEQVKPKKIQFTKEDISKLINNQYKLPDSQVNLDQNDAIFSSYARFKLQQANNLDESDESSLQTSPQKQEDSKAQNIEENKVNEVPFDLLKEFQEATKIKEMIQFRLAFQKGQIKPLDTYNIKVGISTSILAIHSFLVKFFNFYIQKYRDQFISLINMPYGYSINARLRSMKGYPLPEDIQQDDQGIIFGLKDIIDEEKLQEYYNYLYNKQNKINNNFANANIELEKIHSKALIDLFNQELNQYRPYRQINGVPFPWNHSYKALTFYFVTEDNIAEVFEKIQLKILKNSSLLCGILMPNTNQKQASSEFELIQFMEDYQQNNHALILQHNQDKQLKNINEDAKKQSFQYDNQAITKILIQIQACIFEDIMAQSTIQFSQLIMKQNNKFY